jgi:hypothetical protein
VNGQDWILAWLSIIAAVTIANVATVVLLMAFWRPVL